ncbi:hypothetical protein T440DRAFT_507469 [Plenodomus tracheiphilus IPT5]|uniref:BTB domain-containing protein n=1 Tax=Plenodomus tracheiphilus IPT5 TaxID=1408161 RepID=A0A6A7B6F5_9PLEO|nr:hypothetical protein T440DRAFT_507469 [Plenodomus tracheiphilus IPT5]
MERHSERPNKRQKLFATSKAAHSAHLVNISSKIIALKVGGYSNSNVQNAAEEPRQDDSQNEATVIDKANGLADQAGDIDQGDIFQVTDVDPDDRLRERDGVEEGLSVQPGENNSDSDSDSDYSCTIPAGDDSNMDNGSEVSKSSETFSDKMFYVHKRVLCQTSGFFQAATKPEWSGQGKKPIDLSDDDPKIFALYVQWLYTGIVAVKTMQEDSDAEASDEEDVERFEKGSDEMDDLDISKRCLVKCYILGEKLMDAVYRDAIMDILLSICFVEIPDANTIRIAYGGTPVASPLRKLMVDVWVWCGQSPQRTAVLSRERTLRKEDIVGESAAEFAVDLLHALLEHRAFAPIDNPAESAENPPWITQSESYYVQLGAEI